MLNAAALRIAPEPTCLSAEATDALAAIDVRLDYVVYPLVEAVLAAHPRIACAEALQRWVAEADRAFRQQRDSATADCDAAWEPLQKPWDAFEATLAQASRDAEERRAEIEAAS